VKEDSAPRLIAGLKNIPAYNTHLLMTQAMLEMSLGRKHSARKPELP
jgi:hypothetical protein